jgi:hypothetical protein
MPSATGLAEDPLWEFPKLRASLFFEVRTKGPSPCMLLRLMRPQDDFKYVTSDQEADTGAASLSNPRR